MPRSNNSEIDKYADSLGQSSSANRLSTEANQSYVQGALTKTTAVFTDNKTIQAEVSRYGAGFLVTAALFMPGKIGLAGSVVLGALEQASPHSSGSAQLADLALGGLKGAGMRSVMHAMGSKKAAELIGESPAAKGVAFGFANRALEGVLTRQNYLDNRGNLDGATFGANFMHTVANPTAIMSDAATFVVAYGLSAGVSKLNPQLFERTLAQTVATSASFGLSSGASTEIIRQQEEHEKFDLTKIVGRSLLQGGVDAFASIPGGLKANAIARSSFSDRLSRQFEQVNKVEPVEHKKELDLPGVPGELHSIYERSKNSSHVNLHVESNKVTRFVQVDKDASELVLKLKANATEQRRNFIGPLDALEQTIRKLTIPMRSLEQQPERVNGFKTEVEKLAERSDVPGPFDSFDDFYKRGIVKMPTDVRKYTLSGHTVEIVIPERYAGILDDVAAKKPVPEGAEDYSKRVGAADLAPLLDAMPNSGYFKRIFISDKRNPEDAWVSQGGYNSDFISAMSMTEGELNMYKTNRTDYLRRDVLHEWSHELRYEYWEHNLTWRFADAIELESKDFSLSKYADRNNGEQWAVLGERMLGSDARDFIDAGNNAPIRTVIWMRALKKSLETVPQANRSVDHNSYLERQNYVDEHVLPMAVAKINKFIESGTPDQQRRAHDLYKFLQAEGLIVRQSADN